MQGEINTQNKNKGKIMNCGYDPMKTCLLQQIKPPEMGKLWEPLGRRALGGRIVHATRSA